MQGSAEQKAPAALNLRFTTLYTFPPLYTQKPAARRVFVFVWSRPLNKSGPRRVWFASAQRGPFAYDEVWRMALYIMPRRGSS